MMRNFILTWSRLTVLLPLLLQAGVSTVTASDRIPVIAKWGRFEHSFKSTVLYSNAVQDVSLRVVFKSPLGETNEVGGFWDGGRTWRVRFSPDQPGRWKFRTLCSDKTNDGLHNEFGEFICTAATGENRFAKHGPVRLARDQRHLEHADGTPFFWLADTVWNGARVAEVKDWEFYAGIRASQRFTVAQWAAAPGDDLKHESAYGGFPERITINPDFFKRLDAKLEVLSQAGILSAIAPLRELPSQTNAVVVLPDDQAELLVRYIVARWGADPVAWLIAFEGESGAKNAGRWKRIGQAVFGNRTHPPVILFPGETQWVLDEFRDQQWVDVFGYQSVTDVTEDALKWTFTGPLAEEWKKQPARAVIPFTPYENGFIPQSHRRFSSDDVRHAAYWSLLLTPPAGISYGGQGVANWDTTVGPKDEQTKAADLPMWRKALFMPAAKQMSSLAGLMTSIDFWKLRPAPKTVAAQPGEQSPRRFIAAANSQRKRPVGCLRAGRTRRRISAGRAAAFALGLLVQPAHGRKQSRCSCADCRLLPIPNAGRRRLAVGAEGWQIAAQVACLPELSGTIGALVTRATQPTT